MKIALCTEILYPLFGVERRVYEMAKRLPKYGFDVEVLTSSFQHELPDVKIKQVSYPTTKKPPKRSYAQCMKFSSNLYRNLAGNNYDIIDANGHLSLIPCSLAGLRKRKPVVATIHDLYLNEWREMYSGLASFFGLPFEVLFCGMPYTKIIALNSSVRRKMTEMLGMDREKIDIIPSGIDVKEIDGIKSGRRIKNRILYVGRLVPQKNVGMLIEAFKMLESDAELVIVGGGSEYEKLRKMADDDRIIFRGRLESHSDVIGEMKMAGMLVLPSIRENFGIVPLEAMCCGTAVVSTNTEGPRDYITDGENGFLVNIGGVKSLAERMDSLLEDKSLMNKIRENGRRTSEEYDWERIVERIAGLYREIKAE